MEDVYIVAARRTPIGGFLGGLSSLSAPQMGAIVIEAAMAESGISPSHADSVYFGNVLSANIGQSPARQAAILAGIPADKDATTVNKVCASGMKAVMLGAQQIQLGMENIVVAGGMESMSNVPHYLPIRSFKKMGHAQLKDGLLADGLTDAFNGKHMGNAAEQCACEYKLTREDQDAYAIHSYKKAIKATEFRKFQREIVPVAIMRGQTDLLVSTDEDPGKVIFDKIPLLKPTFEENGTITAANASNLNDGAAALILVSGEALAKYQLKPLAKIIAFADAAQEPHRFTTSPALAIQKVFKQANLAANDIDFIEINEAYAAVVLANQKILELHDSRINVYGGAIALGHPLGASGARIITTLISILQQEGGQYGLASICNGGGGASAIIIQNIT